MQLIIEIDKDIYETIKGYSKETTNCPLTLKVYDAIRNGKSLPKGHGDLIYRKSAEAIFKNARKDLYEQSRKEQIKDFHTREMMLLNAEQFVHLIDPIIEGSDSE